MAVVIDSHSNEETSQSQSTDNGSVAAQHVPYANIIAAKRQRQRDEPIILITPDDTPSTCNRFHAMSACMSYHYAILPSLCVIYHWLSLPLLTCCSLNCVFGVLVSTVNVMLWSWRWQWYDDDRPHHHHAHHDNDNGDGDDHHASTMAANGAIIISSVSHWLADSRAIWLCFVMFFVACAPVYWATSRVYRADLPDLSIMHHNHYQVCMCMSSSLTYDCSLITNRAHGL